MTPLAYMVEMMLVTTQVFYSMFLFATVVL